MAWHAHIHSSGGDALKSKHQSCDGNHKFTLITTVFHLKTSCTSQETLTQLALELVIFFLKRINDKFKKLYFCRMESNGTT